MIYFNTNIIYFKTEYSKRNELCFKIEKFFFLSMQEKKVRFYETYDGFRLYILDKSFMHEKSLFLKFSIFFSFYTYFHFIFS